MVEPVPPTARNSAIWRGVQSRSGSALENMSTIDWPALVPTVRKGVSRS